PCPPRQRRRRQPLAARVLRTREAALLPRTTNSTKRLEAVAQRRGSAPRLALDAAHLDRSRRPTLRELRRRNRAAASADRSVGGEGITPRGRRGRPHEGSDGSRRFPTISCWSWVAVLAGPKLRDCRRSR